MKEDQILQLFPHLAGLSLEKRLLLMLPMALLNQMEKGEHLGQVLHQSAAHLPKKKLPQVGTPEFQTHLPELSYHFFTRSRSFILKHHDRLEIISLWSWFPQFRQTFETLLNQPITWIQWDWAEGIDVWHKLQMPPFVKTDSPKERIKSIHHRTMKALNDSQRRPS